MLSLCGDCELLQRPRQGWRVANALAFSALAADIAATHGLHEARASTPTLPSSISLAYALMGDWRCSEREDKNTHTHTSQLYHLPDSATMTICMQSSSVKTRAAKADALATLRPCCRRCSNSRSPRSESINAHLAELNLPRLRFDGGLEVFGKGRQDDVEHLGNIEILSATKIQALPPLTPP